MKLSLVKKEYLLSFNFFLLLTVIVGGSPFLLYCLEKVSGKLTTSDEWYMNGGNHGPWRYEGEGLLMYTPIFLLLLFTFLRTILKPTEQGKIFWFGVLIIFQILILCAQFWFLGWTVG